MEILSHSGVLDNILRDHFGVPHSHRCYCEINVVIALTNYYSVANSSL